jgi:hypothetical protein
MLARAEDRLEEARQQLDRAARMSLVSSRFLILVASLS